MKCNTFYKITSTEDKWYNAFRDIYMLSFPVFEQRNDQQQLAAFHNKNYHLWAILENEKLISFISFWNFEAYLYIEHLAVNPELRGKNIGSKTLNYFAKEVKKNILLEIDPPIDEVSKNRLRFYSRLEYKANHWKHLHPPYNSAYPPHELVVLSLHQALKEEQYQQFYSDLINIVMTE